MKTITILLAEDHGIVREGFRNLLKSEAGFHIIGEAENGRKAVAMTKKLRPDVVVMDIAMPLLNGIEATRQIVKAVPTTKVIILSAHSDDAYIEHVNSVGAAGYLVKQSSASMLTKAIRAVEEGKTFFAPLIARRLSDDKSKRDRKTSKRKIALLTPREMEVLQLIAEGEPNKRIATELEISIKTVEKHRQKIMDKLKIHDTAGLTRYAIGAGIIESSVQLTIV
jgi:DNA-binding NarL/FixJ family response regulator